MIAHKNTNQLITECRETLVSFWGEQLKIEATTRGVAIAMPLMYPDGLQVVVYLEPLNRSSAVLTDRGETLGNLFGDGLNTETDTIHKLLDERAVAFEVDIDGFALTKNVRLPIEGIDLQIFGEALVSIAHLIYRNEPAIVRDNPADKAVRRVFEARGVKPKRNAELEGYLEARIRVDYLVEAQQSLAVEVVRRHTDVLAYMEQWAFRWNDLRRRNDRLLTAMVYDPEHQNWDNTSLRIGKEVCDVFCRYDEAEPLDQALVAVASGNK
jgi:hypothetical protein